MSFKQWLEGQIAYHFVIPKVKKGRETYTVDADTDEASSKVNHKPWDECMKKYVSRGTLEEIELNVLDYVALAADPQFEEYKTILSSVDLSQLSPNEQLALYINAYNCLCVGLIIDHYKDTGSLPESIQNLTTSKINVVWDKTAGNVGGEDVSLNYIEHKVLRNKWAEPRVHASIVCASISCPDLRNEAFLPHKVDSQMTDQFTEWMKNEKKGLNVVDKAKRKVGLSKIFQWFAADFNVKGTTNLKDYVNQFLSGEAKELVSKKSSPRLEYFDYNWHLNNKA